MDTQGMSGAEAPLLKEDTRSMEERLRNAYNDAFESLNLLRDKLSKGGILMELPMDPHIHSLPDVRTPLEGAVREVEYLGPRIREISNSVLL